MWLALARLLRLSLLPSALADVALGLLLGARADWLAQPALAWLFVCAAAIYHGGLALNDWADREADQRTRPTRPLPAGLIRPAFALTLGLCLLGTGAGLAFSLGNATGLTTTTLAVLAAAYNLGLRGPYLGPLLLGACRALNLGNACFAARATIVGAALTWHDCFAPIAYGAYVFALSRVARGEDAIGPLDPCSPRRWLKAAALLLAAAPLTQLGRTSSIALTAGLALSMGSAWSLWTFAEQAGPWTQARAGQATGMALRRLLCWSASVSLACSSLQPITLWTAAAILVGFPLSHALRRAIPPT